MFAEVVAQVAALAEHGVAPSDLAAEVQLDALGVLVPQLDHFMPLGWNPIELLHEGRRICRFKLHARRGLAQTRLDVKELRLRTLLEVLRLRLACDSLAQVQLGQQLL